MVQDYRCGSVIIRGISIAVVRGRLGQMWKGLSKHKGGKCRGRADASTAAKARLDIILIYRVNEMERCVLFASRTARLLAVRQEVVCM